MVYYKIPASSGFTYPRGCVLRRAYPYSTYMYCEFESVTSTESNWVTLSASDFNVNYPTSTAVTPVFVEEMTALSSTLSGGNVVVTLPSGIRTGTTVKFKSPCSCGSVTGGLSINGVVYTIVDSLKQKVNANSMLWEANAMIRVIMDVEQKYAFVQDFLHVYES